MMWASEASTLCSLVSIEFINHWDNFYSLVFVSVAAAIELDSTASCPY